jgi:hypothetical protein
MRWWRGPIPREYKGLTKSWTRVQSGQRPISPAPWGYTETRVIRDHLRLCGYFVPWLQFDETCDDSFVVLPPDTTFNNADGMKYVVIPNFTLLSQILAVIQLVLDSRQIYLNYDNAVATDALSSPYLCVIPYLLMTLVNFVANAFVGSYPQVIVLPKVPSQMAGSFLRWRAARSRMGIFFTSESPHILILCPIRRIRAACFPMWLYGVSVISLAHPNVDEFERRWPQRHKLNCTRSWAIQAVVTGAALMFGLAHLLIWIGVLGCTAVISVGLLEALAMCASRWSFSLGSSLGLPPSSLSPSSTLQFAPVLEYPVLYLLKLVCLMGRVYSI